MIYLSICIMIGMIVTFALIKVFPEETYTLGDVMLCIALWPLLILAITIAKAEVFTDRYLAPIFNKVIHKGVCKGADK